MTASKNKEQILTSENHACNTDCRCDRAFEAKVIIARMNYGDLKQILEFAGVVPHDDVLQARRQLCNVLTK